MVIMKQKALEDGWTPSEIKILLNAAADSSGGVLPLHIEENNSQAFGFIPMSIVDGELFQALQDRIREILDDPDICSPYQTVIGEGKDSITLSVWL